jgi:hypothetical protein
MISYMLNIPNIGSSVILYELQKLISIEQSEKMIVYGELRNALESNVRLFQGYCPVIWLEGLLG